MSAISKFRKTEYRLVVARGWGEKEWGLIWIQDFLSRWWKRLELDRSGGCTIVNILIATELFSLKFHVTGISPPVFKKSDPHSDFRRIGFLQLYLELLNDRSESRGPGKILGLLAVQRLACGFLAAQPCFPHLLQWPWKGVCIVSLPAPTLGLCQALYGGSLKGPRSDEWSRDSVRKVS